MGSRIDESGGEPRTVDEARDAVERSRQRISSTLDQLEDRIVEKKHELQEKVDVMRPVRDQITARPFTAVAVGLAVGVLLGSIGGSEDAEHEHRRSGRVRGAVSDDDRQELRAWRRARRERLRARSRRERERGPSDARDGARFDALKHQLMGAVTSALTAAISARVRQFAMDNIGGDSARSHNGESRRGMRAGRGEGRYSGDRA